MNPVRPWKPRRSAPSGTQITDVLFFDNHGYPLLSYSRIHKCNSQTCFIRFSRPFESLYSTISRGHCNRWAYLFRLIHFPDRSLPATLLKLLLRHTGDGRGSQIRPHAPTCAKIVQRQPYPNALSASSLSNYSGDLRPANGL